MLHWDTQVHTHRYKSFPSRHTHKHAHILLACCVHTHTFMCHHTHIDLANFNHFNHICFLKEVVISTLICVKLSSPAQWPGAGRSGAWTGGRNWIWMRSQHLVKRHCLITLYPLRVKVRKIVSYQLGEWEVKSMVLVHCGSGICKTSRSKALMLIRATRYTMLHNDTDYAVIYIVFLGSFYLTLIFPSQCQFFISVSSLYKCRSFGYMRIYMFMRCIGYMRTRSEEGTLLLTTSTLMASMELPALHPEYQ